MEQLGRHVNAAFLSEYVVSNERLFSHVNAACFFFSERCFYGIILSSHQYSASFSVNVVSMVRL